MRPETPSTARPPRLRLIGFGALVTGAVLAGVGAIGTWAIIGFPAPIRGPELPVAGTDLWEGVVVLASAAVALVLGVLADSVRSSAGRRAATTVVVVLGAAATFLVALTLVRAETRFAQADVLGARLTREAARFLVIRVRPASWFALLGSGLVALGGVLRLAAVRAATASPGPRT